jgi:hypothetical protein
MAEFTPKRKKLLTRPVFKLEIDKVRYFKIESPMHIGKDIKSRTPVDESKKKEPATLCDVTDLTNGELGQLIANTIIKGTLEENYPNESYVGLCFSIMKQKRQEGKQYDKFAIEEIEDPTEEKKEETPANSATQLHTAASKRR